MQETNSEILLCQPDDTKSCAACCGLYNTTDHSFELVDYNLRQRTRLFRRLKGSPDWADRFKAEITDLELPTKKLAEAIYNCSFVGYLNDEETRVGCLLHPLQNDGEDLRDCAFYGKKICASHLCISHTMLSREEKLAVINAIDDWYVYGMCVPDIDLVKSYFRLIAEKVGEEIKGEFLKHAPLKQLAASFFNLTRDWKFKSNENRLGRYYFSYPEYNIARIDYPLLRREKPSEFDSILVSLASDFKNEAELLEAEKLISDNISEFVKIYRTLL
jgi:hypothetical protein